MNKLLVFISIGIFLSELLGIGVYFLALQSDDFIRSFVFFAIFVFVNLGAIGTLIFGLSRK